MTGVQTCALPIYKGFRLLADFIFGNNKTNEGSKKIDMTAPVITRDASEKVDMTAPVISEETDRGWYISFNMPKQYTKETLDRKSTRLNSSHIPLSRMPSSA